MWRYSRKNAAFNPEFSCCTGNIELKYAAYEHHVVTHEYFSI